jgi:hypothetical protein
MLKATLICVRRKRFRTWRSGYYGAEAAKRRNTRASNEVANKQQISDKRAEK